MSKKVGNTGKVYLFEPQPTLADYLTHFFNVTGEQDGNGWANRRSSQSGRQSWLFRKKTKIFLPAHAGSGPSENIFLRSKKRIRLTIIWERQGPARLVLSNAMSKAMNSKYSKAGKKYWEKTALYTIWIRGTPSYKTLDLWCFQVSRRSGYTEQFILKKSCSLYPI